MQNQFKHQVLLEMFVPPILTALVAIIQPNILITRLMDKFIFKHLVFMPHRPSCRRGRMLPEVGLP